MNLHLIRTVFVQPAYEFRLDLSNWSVFVWPPIEFKYELQNSCCTLPLNLCINWLIFVWLAHEFFVCWTFDVDVCTENFVVD